MESESNARVVGGRARRRHDKEKGKYLKRSARLLGFVLALDCSPGATAASAGGSHTCVLLEDGSVKCWGENYHGQLGQNDEIVRGKDKLTMGDFLPAVPLGEFEAVSVESGGEFNCALADGGDVKCWGRNEYGQLGLGDNVTRGGPLTEDDMGTNLPVVDLGTGSAAEEIFLGGMHACALLADGGLKCWGRNDKGQLGLNDTLSRGDGVGEMGDNLPFVELGEGVVVSSVALGEAHTCAIIGDGDVKCWGHNDGGQLGYEDLLPRGTGSVQGLMGDSLPVVDLGRDERAIAVAAGFFHTCAILHAGDVKCWGFGSSGQLGQGTNSSIGNAANTMGDNLPSVDLGTGRSAAAVSLGATHSCAALDDATVKCWGGNARGSLGLGDVVNRGVGPGEMGIILPPVALAFGDAGGDVSNVFAGSYHTCVSGTEGGLACFGINNGGQLGAETDDTALGDEPDEVESVSSIDLGSDVVVAAVPVPGDGVLVETISRVLQAGPTPAPVFTIPELSPTPVPTPMSELVSSGTRAPSVTLPPSGTRAPSVTLPPSVTRAPVLEILPATPGPSAMESDQVTDDAGGTNNDSKIGTVAAIVSAAVLIPLVVLMALFCWRRRKQKQADVTAPPGSALRGFGPDDPATSDPNDKIEDGIREEPMSDDRYIEPHALPSVPAADQNNPAAATGSRADASPRFVSEREELVFATAAAGATAVIGLAVGDSETDGASTSRRAPPGTSNSSEGSDSSSSMRALGSTSAGEALPRPFHKNGDLEHGLEAEAPPPYENAVANIPGARVDSRTPAYLEPPPVETGKSRINAPTQGKANRGALLSEDGDFNDGSTTTTKDVTADMGKTTLVHDGGQGEDVVAAVGAITHDDDAAPRQKPVSSSKGRLNRRSSAGAIDVVDAVVEAGHHVASHSAIPGVCEAARLVSILVRLVTDYQDGSSEVEWRVKRCRSIIFMLERAGEVLAKGGEISGDAEHILIEDVHDAVADLVELIKTYKSKNKMARAITSSLFKRRQEEVEALIDRAVSHLHLGLQVQVGQNLTRVEKKLDQVGQDTEGLPLERRALKEAVETALTDARRLRRQRNLDRVEIPEDHVTVTDELLGKGGFGAVYLADFNGRNAAAKVLLIDHELGKPTGNGTSSVEGKNGTPLAERVVSKQRKAFLKEVETMVRLRSPHTVNVFGAITARNDRLVLVMELLSGGDLYAFLKTLTGPLPAEHARRIICDVCAGVAFFHSKDAVHGDLKSANVLLDGAGRAKIGDFGTSRWIRTNSTGLVTHTTKTSQNNQMSFAWAAPEVLEANGVSSASDVYSLGMVAWEVLSREVPWANETLPRDIYIRVVFKGDRPPIPVDTPADIADTIKGCWAGAPENRLTSSEILKCMHQGITMPPREGN